MNRLEGFSTNESSSAPRDIGFAGKEIVISPKHIERISYEDSKVFVSVTKEAIENAPEYYVHRGAFDDSSAVAKSL